MNSPMQRPREMIRFEHPHEWQGREGFRPSLTLVEADVSHFVGGYNLPKDLYQHCGLAHGGKALALAFEPNRLPTNDRGRRILRQLCEGTS